LPFIAELGGLALVPGVAAAKAPTCPTRGAEKTTITWGAPDDAYSLSTVSVTSGIRLGGLAAHGERHPPTIRTRRDAAGRGHPVLCAGGRVRASLPILARGRTIQAASVNGTTIAWRQTTSKTRSTIVRATVRNAGLRDFRRALIRVANRKTAASDHRMVVTLTGTVAWALDSRKGSSSGSEVSVWPRTHSAPTAPRTAGTDDVLNLRVLDNQNVLTDGSRTPVRYAPATPGRCPVLTDPAPIKDLAGWNVAEVRGWSLGDASEVRAESWNVVCDPRTGGYVDIVGDEAGGTPGHDSGARNATHLVRSGDWLVSTQHGEGSFVGDETLIANATTRRHYLATGQTDGPGIDHIGEYHTAPPPSGAVVGPGYVAFIAINPNDTITNQTLVLSDANGTRTVASGTATAPLGGLASDGTTLTWTTTGTPRTAAIVPKTDTPYAITRPDGRDHP
jgi:hypothetical protein